MLIIYFQNIQYSRLIFLCIFYMNNDNLNNFVGCFHIYLLDRYTQGPLSYLLYRLYKLKNLNMFYICRRNLNNFLNLFHKYNQDKYMSEVKFGFLCIIDNLKMQFNKLNINYRKFNKFCLHPHNNQFYKNKQVDLFYQLNIHYNYQSMLNKYYIYYRNLSNQFNQDQLTHLGNHNLLLFLYFLYNLYKYLHLNILNIYLDNLNKFLRNFNIFPDRSCKSELRFFLYYNLYNYLHCLYKMNIQQNNLNMFLRHFRICQRYSCKWVIYFFQYYKLDNQLHLFHKLNISNHMQYNFHYQEMIRNCIRKQVDQFY